MSLSVCNNNREIMEEYGIMEYLELTVRAVDGKQRIYLEWPKSVAGFFTCFLDSLSLLYNSAMV